MTLEIAAKTLELVGSVFIAYAALRVHHRVLNEHKIDKKVFSVMRREQTVGILGVIMVIIGYLLNLMVILG